MFEYSIETCDSNEYNFERWLNDRAKDGWRLHTVIRVDWAHYECFFEKRHTGE